LLLLLQEKAYRSKTSNLINYKPYPKQKLFHDLGLSKRERLFRAGNQLGKTLAGGMEMAMHLTGNYPEWWKGRRFATPIIAWASGVTGESTRDNPQRIMFGRPGQLGTGTIPGRSIVGDPVRGRGIADSFDFAKVKHKTGGSSIIYFKSYEKGREKWQGDSVHVVWFDEEPPPDVYSEGVTRTNATKGLVFITATPLLGMSEVIRRFIMETNEDRADINMTIDDVDHYTQEERDKIVASYPEHEREARAKGIPILGSGRIFPIAEEAISCEPFPIPDYFAQIGGLDFGWDHPTAAVHIAWDRDVDKIFIINVYKAKEQTPVIHAAAVKPWGEWLPWSWPHDALQHDKGSGDQLAALYAAQGLNMTDERATFEDGTNGVEAGLMDMLERMQTGRLKVFRHLVEWFDEFRLYHRKDGKVVKEFDDIISATRYAIMMKRHAITKPRPKKINGSTGAGNWMSL
jgi:phage terminase large subunit-like protein